MIDERHLSEYSLYNVHCRRGTTDGRESAGVVTHSTLWSPALTLLLVVFCLIVKSLVLI